MTWANLLAAVTKSSLLVIMKTVINRSKFYVALLTTGQIFIRVLFLLVMVSRFSFSWSRPRSEVNFIMLLLIYCYFICRFDWWAAAAEIGLLQRVARRGWRSGAGSDSVARAAAVWIAECVGALCQETAAPRKVDCRRISSTNLNISAHAHETFS